MIHDNSWIIFLIPPLLHVTIYSLNYESWLLSHPNSNNDSQLLNHPTNYHSYSISLFTLSKKLWIMSHDSWVILPQFFGPRMVTLLPRSISESFIESGPAISESISDDPRDFSYFGPPITTPLSGLDNKLANAHEEPSEAIWRSNEELFKVLALWNVSLSQLVTLCSALLCSGILTSFVVARGRNSRSAPLSLLRTSLVRLRGGKIKRARLTSPVVTHTRPEGRKRNNLFVFGTDKGVRCKVSWDI